MPEYKLIYFNARGRAELTRWIFSYADVPFEDKRIEKEEWAPLKPTTVLGKLPVLEIDGHPLPQSHAMARYMAKKAGLIPKDDIQAAWCDAIVDTISDISLVLYDIHLLTSEEERKKKFMETNEKTIKPAFTEFEKLLKNHDWIVGDSISWADLALGSDFGEILKRKEFIFAPYPSLVAHIKKVRSLPKIKQWLDKAPQTQF